MPTPKPAASHPCQCRPFNRTPCRYAVITANFAPQDILRKNLSQRFTAYRAVDLYRADVDYHYNMENTGLPPDGIDLR
jgi:hypothetical protein